MADTTGVTRDKRGNWSPDYLETLPAPMVWPPRLLAILKWLFGWPGYLWPWNAVYLGFALLAYWFLTPPLADMATFEAWWIAAIFARNVGLTIFFFGGLHLYLYMAKGQGTDFRYSTRMPPARDKSRLFGRQVRENVFWSLASGVTMWTAYEVVTWWLYANEMIPYLDFASNPVWFVVLLLLIPLIREVHFYLTHRLLHWKPLYRSAHYLHHRNVNIGPWSGLSMHPIEHFLYFSGVLLHWVIASHPIHAMFHVFHAGLSPAAGQQRLRPDRRRERPEPLHRRVHALPPPPVFRVQLRRRRAAAHRQADGHLPRRLGRSSREDEASPARASVGEACSGRVTGRAH